MGRVSHQYAASEEGGGAAPPSRGRGEGGGEIIISQVENKHSIESMKDAMLPFYCVFNPVLTMRTGF